MPNMICTHDEERPERSKLGLTLNCLFGICNWEKEYFCKQCKSFIGYYSRIKSVPITKTIDGDP